ncbi:hypothetical protein [Paraburkholderia humisilvae]|uniref:Uncharacterized protein n=1 Tax=Paraburkholderia humisilvae TaxID=627669 RepID=A0A6J5DR92_9BURK|nr:hypothetical protein [Paraburkholderia humisilvae]CAB3755811.1 hypothetical protein LMG29542_02701 [Paraburkholderia humisilvae]
MKGSSSVVREVSEEESRHVPPVGAVVAPSVLARVFAGQPLPFATNPDGSVDLDVYRAWLESIWKEGMDAFEEQSSFVVVQSEKLKVVHAFTVSAAE